MSIVTKGLGSEGIITQGYDWLHWIEEVVKKVVKRFIPIKRKKVIQTIAVVGYPTFSVQGSILITGNPFERKELVLPALGSPSVPIVVKSPVEGSPFSNIQEIYKVQGNLSESVSTSLQLLGTTSTSFELKLSCEGEKDFKKVLWEILEDENGDE